MARYAVVQGGVVTNVALWDGNAEWGNSTSAVLLPDDSLVSEGYTYDGQSFSPSTEEVGA